MMRSLLRDNLFLALLAASFLVATLEVWGFLFLFPAFFLIFCVLLNEATELRRGVESYLSWALLSWYVYCVFASAWLLNLNIAFFFLTVHALFLGFFLYLAILRFSGCSGASPLRDALLAGALWATLGWVYGKTPFSGLIFSLPFLGPSSLLQAGSLIGYEAYSGILVAFHFSLAVAVKRKSTQAGIFAVVLGGVILAVAAWGSTRQPPVSHGGELKISIVQHNLPFSFHWKRAHRNEIREKHRQLAQETMRDETDIVIFPQYTISNGDLTEPAFLGDIARDLNKHLLFASHLPMTPDRFSPAFHYHMNAGVLVAPSGEVVDYYQALRAPMTEEGAVRSEKYKVLKTPWGRLGLLLCYEDIYPDIVKKAVDAGAEVLIALSNPGQFSGTFLPRQHLFQDRLRAIESGRYLIRVSPNGYSAVVDPSGRILDSTRLRREDILYSRVPMQSGKTFFHRIYDFTPVFLALMIGVLWPARTRGPKESSNGQIR